MNMRMTALGVMAVCLVIVVTVSAIGGHWMAVNSGMGDTPVPAVMGTPNPITFIDWLWSSVQFFFNLNTFNVPGVPDIFSLVFFVINALGFLSLLFFIRGD